MVSARNRVAESRVDVATRCFADRENAILVINDPGHWRRRAAETRNLAASITDPEGKRRMLEIAANYDRIAQRAVEREVAWTAQARLVEVERRSS